MSGVTAETCIHVHLGGKEYLSCLELQRRVRSLRQQDLIPDCLLIVEHPSVFTIGRSGRRDNLLIDEAELQRRDIPVVDIERGGDITYHGPGQLVVYPIFKLKGKGCGVADFICDLEEVMLQLLRDYRIEAGRNQKNRGVWVGQNKIGFVGIAVRQGVTLHGLALNVAVDLNYFSMINPCGLSATPISSMDCLLKSTDRTIAVADVARRLSEVVEMKFDQRTVTMGADTFATFIEEHTHEVMPADC